MDIVLMKEGTASVGFCFSAYMQQKFEMCMMNQTLVMDESMQNHGLEITEDEFGRCWTYLDHLVQSETKYDYTDALMRMPAANVLMASAMCETEDVADTFPRKVFCSQSVVLMLRTCLDASEGALHANLVQRMHGINSRLASPKEVFSMLEDHKHTVAIPNEELMDLIYEARHGII